MRIEIVIKVDYDEASIDNVTDLKAWLEDNVRRLVGNGGLSPAGEYIVDDWRCSVEQK